MLPTRSRSRERRRRWWSDRQSVVRRAVIDLASTLRIAECDGPGDIGADGVALHQVARRARTRDSGRRSRGWPRSRCQHRLPSRQSYCSPRLRQSGRRSTRFPGRFVPVTSVPMKLCWTTTPVVPAPVIKMPEFPLAEITLPAPAVVPPMVMFVAPPSISTPEYAFPRAFVPVTLVPMMSRRRSR